MTGAACAGPRTSQIQTRTLGQGPSGMAWSRDVDGVGIPEQQGAATDLGRRSLEFYLVQGSEGFGIIFNSLVKSVHSFSE